MLCNFVRRAGARKHQITLRLGAATLVVALLAASSHAALMGTYSLRFDGFVKQGANTGEEGHFAANLPYLDNIPPKNLPANVDPPGPLANANDLRLTDTETAGVMIFSITNPTGGNIFANPLDPAIPVEWEAIFTFDGLGPLEKIAITDIDFINGDETNPETPVSQVTGKGTAADPLRVFLQIAPDQFNPIPTSGAIVGPVKVHLSYMTMQIPEPASIALGMLGLLGITGLMARRRR